VAFEREAPPHIPKNRDNRVPSVRIEEVTEADIVQVINNEEDSESDNENQFDFFQVLATEKRKRETRCSRLPEFQSSTSSQAFNVTPPTSTPGKKECVLPAAFPPTDLLEDLLFESMV
jgi:hypothetical protein